MQKLKALFFDCPMFSDGSISRENLANDNCQNREIPRGLHCIASFLQSQGKNVRLVIPDAFFTQPICEKGVFQQKINSLVAEKIEQYDPEFVGFAMMYGFTERTVLEMTRFTKSRFPQKKVVVGGNHATFRAERLLDPKNETGIDIVVRGEGERSMLELLSGISLSEISGISFRKDGKVFHCPNRELQQIKDLPPNDFSVLEIGNQVGIADFNPMLQYARGCAFNCAFCTNEKMWGCKVRPHNIESFRRELFFTLALQQEYRQRELVTVFMDDNILASKKYWKPLFPILEKAVDLFPQVQFAAQARVSSVMNEDSQTNEMLSWLERTNFKILFLGIETGSQIILDAMKKRCRATWIKRACANLKKHDVLVGAFWMFGHPGATPKEEEISIKLMDELFSEGLLDTVEVHMTIPFPGTRIRNDPRVKLLFSEEEEVKRYSLTCDAPIHCLVDEETGRIVMSEKQISESFQEALVVKNKHLGEKIAAVSVSSSLRTNVF